MVNTAPFEIIAAPFEAWIAPVGEAFPELDVAPAGGWTKIGASGNLNYTEDGVVVSNPQEVAKFRAVGSTGPRKAFRTSEDFSVSFTVADMTLEAWANALNGNTITNVAGSPRKIGLSRGLEVSQYALLLRGPSPYGDGWQTQFEIPVCVEAGSREVTFRKDVPAGLALQFDALEDPNAASPSERFGRLMVQDAAGDT